MKRNLFTILGTVIGFFLCTSLYAINAQQIPIPEILKDSKQLVVVLTPDWKSPEGQLFRFTREETSNDWQTVGNPAHVIVGKNGLAWSGELQLPPGTNGPIKKEGDLKAPAGVFSLGPAFGFLPKGKQQTKLFYLPIKATTVCVDDSHSRFYGRILDSAKAEKDWNSSEQMHQIKQYELGVVIDYNMETPKPGIGSCVFIHLRDNNTTGTAGCTAVARPVVATLFHWLDSEKSPVIVQLTKNNYQQLQTSWKLPVINN
jgi:zinc D-Ala-D-Ala dipeptidase